MEKTIEAKDLGHPDQKKDQDDGEKSHPKTIYPSHYTPPVIAEDPLELMQPKPYNYKPRAPMVDKTERPIEHHEDDILLVPITEKESHQEWLRDPVEDRSEDWSDDEQEWVVKSNLRGISERGRQLADFAQLARSQYKKKPLAEEDHVMYLNQEMPNETVGSAMIEENEKERELELYRLKSEQELKDDYDQRIMELTSDYKAKLKDLDNTYVNKREDLDRQRSEIERSMTMA